MRVVMPYATIPSLDVATPLGAPWDPIYVGDSDRAYFDLLLDLWRQGETFCVVEHDIVIHRTALADFADCPHHWCSFPFEYMGKVTHGLGCVKFSAGLIARNRTALIQVGTMHDERHDKRHWCRLDAWLTVVLRSRGEERHEHETMVRHLNSGCSHGCTTTG